MKKTILLLCFIFISISAYCQFKNDCVTIDVKGLNPNLASAFINNKNIFVDALNNFSQDNRYYMCNLKIEIRYLKGVGVIQLVGYYTENVFWNGNQISARQLWNLTGNVALHYPWQLALAISSYKKNLSYLINNSQINDFEIKVKLIKQNTQDYIVILFDNDQNLSISNMYVISKNKRYIYSGSSNSERVYPTSLFDLNGEKADNYYIFNFLGLNPQISKPFKALPEEYPK